MEMDTTATQAAPLAAATGGRLRLTPAQRLQFDVYGYVLLENVLTPDEDRKSVV